MTLLPQCGPWVTRRTGAMRKWSRTSNMTGLIGQSQSFECIPKSTIGDQR